MGTHCMSWMPREGNTGYTAERTRIWSGASAMFIGLKLEKICEGNSHGSVCQS